MTNTLNTDYLNQMLVTLSKYMSDRRGTTVKLTAEPGRKYIRLVEQACVVRPALVEQAFGSRPADPRYVYCFIDYDGNIYKPASWKAPAKHVRGSVFDPDYSWGRALGPYGVAYLR